MIYCASDLETEAPLAIHIEFGTAARFPAREVEACIRQTLDQQVGTQSALRPRVASACEPEIDSLVVVEMICAIEAILGVTIPPTFVPRGGYDDVEACVNGLLAETRAMWVKLIKEKQHHD
jgi:acyl carrier protein